MRNDPKPYWKKSHSCFYVNVAGKQIRLSPDETEARQLYLELLLDRKPVTTSTPIHIIIKQFLEYKKRTQATGVNNG
jgi:hypothetical protein